MPILVVVIVAFGLAFYFYQKSKSGGGMNSFQFHSKAKEAGFSAKETEILRNLALQCGIENPSYIFTSQHQFETCIRSFVMALNKSGVTADIEAQDFLSRLYDYRKKFDVDKPSCGIRIANTRQITDGQSLKILIPGVGVYFSQVVSNSSQSFIISRPVCSKNAPAVTWNGVKISVYFWREDDAGYVFDSDVQAEVLSKGVLALKISHNDTLFRTQRRKSKRLKINKPAFLYPVTEDEEPHKSETTPGIKCLMEDISDSGCSFTVGGNAEGSIRKAKVQFALGNSAVCMSGTVRSINFKNDTNRSIVRMEADELPTKTRNIILGEIFGTASDDEDEELPFRVIEEEAANYTETKIANSTNLENAESAPEIIINEIENF